MMNPHRPALENLTWRLAEHPEADWDGMLYGPSPGFEGNLALDYDYCPEEWEIILVQRQARIIQFARNIADQAAVISMPEREAWINTQCDALREKWLLEQGDDPDTQQGIKSDVLLFRHAIHKWLFRDCTALGEV